MTIERIFYPPFHSRNTKDHRGRAVRYRAHTFIAYLAPLHKIAVFSGQNDRPVSSAVQVCVATAKDTQQEIMRDHGGRALTAKITATPRFTRQAMGTTRPSGITGASRTPAKPSVPGHVLRAGRISTESERCLCSLCQCGQHHCPSVEKKALPPNWVRGALTSSYRAEYERSREMLQQACKGQAWRMAFSDAERKRRFHGQSTTRSDFHDASRRKKPLTEKEMNPRGKPSRFHMSWGMQPGAFYASTESRDNYTARGLNVVGTARPRYEQSVRVPFRGSSTQRSDFQARPASAGARLQGTSMKSKAMAQLHVPPARFNAQTEAQAAFVPHRSARPASARLNAAGAGKKAVPFTGVSQSSIEFVDRRKLVCPAASAPVRPASASGHVRFRKHSDGRYW